MILYVVLTHTTCFILSFCVARTCNFYAHTVRISWPASTWLLTLNTNSSCPMTSPSLFKQDGWILNNVDWKETKAASLCAIPSWKKNNNKKNNMELQMAGTCRQYGLSVLRLSSVSQQDDSFSHNMQNTTSTILKTIPPQFVRDLWTAAMWEIGPWNCLNWKTADQNFRPVRNKRSGSWTIKLASWLPWTTCQTTTHQTEIHPDSQN